MPGTLLVGPLPPPPSRLQVDPSMQVSQGQLDAMFSEVWQQARIEFASLMNTEFEEDEAKTVTRFRWEPAVGTPARPPNATPLSFVGRLVATRVKTIERHCVVDDPFAVHWKQRVTQLRRVHGAITSYAKMRGACDGAVKSLQLWFNLVEVRSELKDRSNLSILATAAFRKASNLEKGEFHKDITAWCMWFSGPAAPCPTQSRCSNQTCVSVCPWTSWLDYFTIGPDESRRQCS